MSAFHNNALAGASGNQGYRIERSLRFNSPDSAYLNRTPASAGNRKTWTISWWIKKTSNGSAITFFDVLNGSAGNPRSTIGFTSSDTFDIQMNPTGASWSVQVTTTQVFRDPSSWYHFVLSLDTTQATTADRIKLYVNGSQITAFSAASYPSQNTDQPVNQNVEHRIGYTYNGIQAINAYLTEINFIDGQALTPSSFGETDTITGVWKPKKYAGTYGTNGFYLKFADNSGTTSTTLGKDSSPNGNNWTPNNFSVTAGAGNDSMIDTPTPYADGGNGRGNYCTLNPLRTALTPTNGNLTITGNNTWRGTAATMQIPASGLYYFEVSTSTANQRIVGGLVTASLSMSATWQSTAGFIGVAADSLNWNVMNNVSAGSTLLYSLGGTGASEVIGIAINATTGNMWFSRNNVWYNSTGSATGDPAAGTNPTWTGLTASNYFPAAQCYDNAVDVHINFGQRAFAYTPPSGFLALNTQNLPEPSIKKPNQWMDATLYTGNGSTQTIVNAGGFQPDLVWNKDRSNISAHALFDSVRGVTKELYSNLTDAEGTASGVTAFNTNGYSLGSNTRSNNNGSSFVGWQWKKSATPGFDIVSFASGTAGDKTFSHALGIAPSFMIVKSRDESTYNWGIYHSAVCTNQQFFRFTTDARVSPGYNVWGTATPTSSVFGVSVSDTQGIVKTNQNCIAYLWSEVAGFSKFGSYSGTGSSDGPFVFLGFRPKFVMFKRSDSTGSWFLEDSARGTYNVMGPELYANLSDAESTVNRLDFLSNGFKLRAANPGDNASGGTYIYAAFAETPFRYSLAR